MEETLMTVGIIVAGLVLIVAREHVGRAMARSAGDAGVGGGAGYARFATGVSLTIGAIFAATGILAFVLRWV